MCGAKNIVDDKSLGILLDQHFTPRDHLGELAIIEKRNEFFSLILRNWRNAARGALCHASQSFLRTSCSDVIWN